ncbi:hypothetical protein CEXT_282671 [Caerostris extrusa]|uniref:Uncharacterized protein n=1 Tax=Caerostris extrusa TaxID=172846 RepID=A0AAV4WBN5_CAEEX|nr:hypothetical protein CEXT_282671 [Caerostris extrusa]
MHAHHHLPAWRHEEQRNELLIDTFRGIRDWESTCCHSASSELRPRKKQIYRLVWVSFCALARPKRIRNIRICSTH